MWRLCLSKLGLEIPHMAAGWKAEHAQPWRTGGNEKGFMKAVRQEVMPV